MDQLCWHPNHPDLLVTASGDKTVRLYDCRATKAIKTIETPGIIRLAQMLNDNQSDYHFCLGENINICWSPDGKCIAVGNKDDLIAFIDTRNYRFLFFIYF